jgi:hypothetical protein
MMHCQIFLNKTTWCIYSLSDVKNKLNFFSAKKIKNGTPSQDMKLKHTVCVHVRFFFLHNFACFSFPITKLHILLLDQIDLLKHCYKKFNTFYSLQESINAFIFYALILHSYHKVLTIFKMD